MDIIAPTLFFTALLALLGMYLNCIIDIHRSKEFNLRQRRNWINIIYFIPLIGSFMYLFRNRLFVKRLSGFTFRDERARQSEL